MVEPLPEQPDPEPGAEPEPGLPPGQPGPQQRDALLRLIGSLDDVAVILLDREGRVQTWNRGAHRLKGYEASEIVGESFSRFYPEEAVAVGHPERELEIAAAMGKYQEEGWRVRRDGTRFWAHVTIVGLFDDEGDLTGYGKVTRDLTERKQAEEQQANVLKLLEETARTDSLTGLPNRRSWDEQLVRELARAKRTDQPLCVAVIDIDRFKAVNDELGHGAGDRFLKRAAYAWRSALRLSDILARWGGEEFVACFPDCELDAAVAVVERIRAATPDGRTCSAGVARWDGSESVESLIGRADRAMYAAKDGGRDRTESARHIGPA